VLLVDYSVGFGGAIKSLGLVSHAMAGVSPRVLTCQEPSEIQRWYAGFPVHRFRTTVNYRSLGRVRDRVPAGVLGRFAMKGIAGVDLLATGWNLLRVRALLRRYPVDVAHLNNGIAPPEALHAVHAAGVPCVVHMRGFPSPKEVRRAAQRVRKIIAISRSIAQAVAAGGFPAQDTPIVWDPVDLDLFARTATERAAVRARLGLRNADVAVGIFGRVVRWKGQLEFVRAALRVLKAGLPIRPVVVGDVSDGRADYLEEVRSLALGSPYADRFVFAGYQPEPAPYYHAMDVVVHASIEPEPFGMVVPEGMAAGKAVIGAAAGGPGEVIEPGVDGVLTPPGDVAALADAIARVAQDAAFRAALGARAHAKARARFSIAQAASQTLAVWEAALR